MTDLELHDRLKELDDLNDHIRILLERGSLDRAATLEHIREGRWKMLADEVDEALMRTAVDTARRNQRRPVLGVAVAPAAPLPDAVFIIVAVLGVAFIAYVVMTCIRNERAYRFRRTLIELAGEANRRDILAGRGYSRWRYDRINSVSYDRLLYQFWKPLTIEAWYGDDQWLS